MTTIPTVSMADFVTAVEKLDSAGNNWVTFQRRFVIAVKQKRVFGHFDGTATKPAVSNPPTAVETVALAAWQEKEDTAMYLLSQKLADLTLTKYIQGDCCPDVVCDHSGIHAEEHVGTFEHAFEVHGYALRFRNEPPRRAGLCPRRV